MNDKMLTKIFIGLVVLGVGLLIYSQMNKEKPNQEYLSEVNKKLERLEALEKEIAEKKLVSADKLSELNEEKQKKVPEESLEERQWKESAEVKQNYFDVVKAKVDLPANLKFISVDIDDEGEAIYGYDHLTGMGLTLMAAPVVVDQKEVLPYLDKSQSYIPNTRDNPVVKIGGPQNLPAPKEETNLKDATLWSGTLKDGKDVHVLMLRRKDDKGSYFFLATGKKEYFQANDDYFEQMYNDFRALPEEKK